jgi:predicted DCC family thiol-disulfide oxidoreductase YuxK
MSRDGHCLILFDGVCVLCSRLVDFIVAHDSSARFRFAPLQTEVGRRVLSAYGVPVDTRDTLILIEGGQVYSESTAALRIARRLDGGWGIAYALIVLPRWLRDLAYRYVGRHRYEWFGQMNECRIPGADEVDRFLH